MTPTIIHIERVRGDTYAEEFNLDDDLTGASVMLTVDPSAEPADNSTMLFEVVGTITDAANGIVEFAISEDNADQDLDEYRYDIQVTDAEGIITTVVRGKWRVIGDITK